jgi:hypothetical protein
LTFSAGENGATGDPVQFSQDFQCIAALGIGGCGFEEQLEAPLKALWPAVYSDTAGNVITPNPITFLSTTQHGTLGHGDQPLDQGGNLGFLRNDPKTPSLLAIVLVTDEEDCSPHTTDFLSPVENLGPDSPYSNEDINLRCFYNQDKLYDVATRYYRGFKQLHASAPDSVVFAAIAGVPADLVDADARATVDWSNADARDAYYDAVLSDPRMQLTIDPSTNPGSGTGNLLPSCTFVGPKGEAWTADPPRRIVQLAKLFGEQAMLQSICQDDFAPAIDAITGMMGKRIAASH